MRSDKHFENQKQVIDSIADEKAAAKNEVVALEQKLLNIVEIELETIQIYPQYLNHLEQLAKQNKRKVSEYRTENGQTVLLPSYLIENSPFEKILIALLNQGKTFESAFPKSQRKISYVSFLNNLKKDLIKEKNLVARQENPEPNRNVPPETTVKMKESSVNILLDDAKLAELGIKVIMGHNLLSATEQNPKKTHDVYNADGEKITNRSSQDSKIRKDSKFAHVRDVMGEPVIDHVSKLDHQAKQAQIIQTYWRQNYRAKVLHREHSLFGKKSKNTMENRFDPKQVPLQFRQLALQKIPPILTTINHASSNLSAILHDGAIFPKHQSGITGETTAEDEAKFEHRLVFFSPFYKMYDSNVMSLSLDKLIENNHQGKDLYFKFRDWAIDKSNIISVPICSLPYDLILVSIDMNQEIDSEKMQSISQKSGLPILIRRGNDIYIYGMFSQAKGWALTQLDSEVFRQLTFPSEASVIHREIITSEMYQEIEKKMGHLPKEVILKIDINAGKDPSTVHVFDSTGTSPSSFTMELPNEEFVFHGYRGLNSYLTFFLFKIIENMPIEQQRLKSELYNYFAELNEKGQLIGYLQTIMQKILHYSEIDFVNKVRLNFESLKNVSTDDIIYDFDQLREQIKLDNADAIKKFFAGSSLHNSYFIVKGMLDYAIAHNATRVVQFVTEEFKTTLEMASEQNTLKLLQAIKYIYKHHLCNPYKDATLYPFDVQMTINKEIIHRPNHGLAHTVRVADYAKYIIDYFKTFAKDDNFRTFCQNITPEKLLEIEIALLFRISGRESEAGFRDDPKLYDQYRENGVNNFLRYAKLIGMSPADQNKYAELIRHAGNPEYPTKGNHDPEKNYIFYIMNFAHNLDLMRCYDANSYLKAITFDNQVVESSPDQQKGLHDLLNIVSMKIKATGDRLVCSYSEVEEKVVDVHKPYDQQSFLQASKNPTICTELVQSVSLPQQENKASTQHKFTL